MLGYLQKFNNLPAGLRQKVSDQAAMAAIETLERKYNLALAALVMRVMVKEVALNDLPEYLLKENLTPDQAGALAKELKEKIFSSLGNYLSAAAPAPVKAEAEDEPAVKGASFFFSHEDEDEIRELAKKIDLAEKTVLPAAAIEKKLEEIIRRAQINFGSTDLADRFKQILKTYLRSIRNRLEAKATLIKSFSSGGLSFDENSAEKVMSLADKIIHPVKSRSAGIPPEAELFNGVRAKEVMPDAPPPKIKLPEKTDPGWAIKPIIARDAPYIFPSKPKAIDKSALAADLKTLDTTHELPAPPPEEKAVRPLKSGPTAGAVAAEAGQMPLIRRRFEAENLNASQKARIEDVKYVPRVMSPLDELKYLDLVNFRRLDKDPALMAEKIKSKINLLEEDGYAKKLEGIKSWRFSPLNKLYLAIGQSSIGENKPVDVIIEEKKIKGEACPTVEEFRAIMDLNKSLRF
ncbi:MAG: hypothetical protein Q7R92_04085 [bacterium]|nr:hypothetical protein [bacterium]